MGIHHALLKKFPGQLLSFTGSFRRQNEIINEVEWVSAVPEASITRFLKEHQIEATGVQHDRHIYRGSENIPLSFSFATNETFYRQLFTTAAARISGNMAEKIFRLRKVHSEEEIFSQAAY